MADDPETQPDIVDDDPEIPAGYPSTGGSDPEIHDEPLGVPEDADPDEQPLPGVPRGKEPPDAG